MATLLRDHRAEIEDILAADKQLARELLFDIKQAEMAAKTQDQTAVQVHHLVAVAPPAEPSVAQPVDLGVPPKTAIKGASRRNSDAMALLTKTPLTTDSRQTGRTPGAMLATAGKTPFTGASNGTRPSAAPTPAPLRSGTLGRSHAAAIPMSRVRDDQAEVVVQLRSPEGLSREPLQPWNINLSGPKGGQGAGGAKGKVRKATHVVHEAAAEASAIILGSHDEVKKTEGTKPQGKKGRQAAVVGGKRKA